ncbi:MAG: nucleotidyltransferase family protein, partial [Chloroflexi bacterium]|nr:nucleotidyltransferase family protein [Chloroflexota bacterium]
MPRSRPQPGGDEHVAHARPLATRLGGAISPSDSALLALLRAAPDTLPASADRAAIDWPRALPLLDTLGLAPLLAFRLRAAGLEQRLRSAVWDALWQRYLATAAQNTRLLAELARIARALEVVRVPALAYKGATLAATGYPSVGCRPMGDLDLLVSPAQVDRALAALATAGYRLDSAGPPSAFLLRYGTQALLVGPSGVHLDLHWQLFTEPWLAAAFPVDLAGLWTRALPYARDGARLLRPAPADELLLLCLHLALHHSYAGVLPYVDLDLLARAGCPWPTFVALAHTCG